MNGVSKLSFEDQGDMNSFGLDLVIGNESDVETKEFDEEAFGGNMLYFHVVRDFAKYTADFTVPTGFPSINPEYYSYLITATETLGDLSVSIQRNNVDVSPMSPFQQAPQASVPRILRSLFSDNTKYYKRGSLPACGVGGTAGTMRAKARRT